MRLLLFAVPIKIPFSIKTSGKLLPSQEWIVYRGTNGQLMTSLTDYESGINNNYSSNQFDRGDAVRLIIKPEIRAGNNVSAQDTVGYLESDILHAEFIKLKGDLDESRIALKLNLTGEKESIIAESEEKLSYSKKKSLEQIKILARLEKLFERDLISEEEYEIEKGKSELYKIEISIAEAQLEAVRKGAKEEQIDLIKTKINSLENQISNLKARISKFVLISPITGMIPRISEGDTILTVVDTTKYLVFMPVRWKERSYCTLNSLVNLTVPNGNGNLEARIINIGKEINSLNGEQVFIVLAEMIQSDKNLLPGLIVDCSIQSDPLNPIDYIGRVFKLMESN